MKRIFTITTATVAVILCSGAYQDEKFEEMRLTAETRTRYYYYDKQDTQKKRRDKPRLDKIDDIKKRKMKKEQEIKNKQALDEFFKDQRLK
ncbi:TPA: hypothetical protein R4323_001087 [Pasteurella multocida]|nr:hypothetical protein [Pasteurella multocida]HED4399664.1 hypothetical protein [Pasteurella multocida]